MTVNFKIFPMTENVAVDPILVNGNAHNKQVAAVTDGDKTDASCVNLNGSDSRLQIDTGEQRAIAVIILTLPKGTLTQSNICKRQLD